jgi:hypothetical protein
MTEAPFANEPDYFAYLDNLRETGETNMFGAAPYLEQEFNLDPRTARDVTLKWMKTFSARRN